MRRRRDARLREARVLDDLSGPTVEILATLTKSVAEARLKQFGDPA
jgi:hypothetical protein